MGERCRCLCDTSPRGSLLEGGPSWQTGSRKLKLHKSPSSHHARKQISQPKLYPFFNYFVTPKDKKKYHLAALWSTSKNCWQNPRGGHSLGVGVRRGPCWQILNKCPWHKLLWATPNRPPPPPNPSRSKKASDWQTPLGGGHSQALIDSDLDLDILGIGQRAAHHMDPEKRKTKKTKIARSIYMYVGGSQCWKKNTKKETW